MKAPSASHRTCFSMVCILLDTAVPCVLVSGLTELGVLGVTVDADSGAGDGDGDGRGAIDDPADVDGDGMFRRRGACGGRMERHGGMALLDLVLPVHDTSCCR